MLLTWKRGHLARRGRPPFSKSGIGPWTLPFNVADEVSCRAGAIKCSRCRASFAPIHPAFSDGIWFPRWIDNSADPLSETKNCRKFLTSPTPSQVKPLYSVTIILRRDCLSQLNAQTHYGLHCYLDYLDIGYRPCRRRHRETVDARERSRRLHHYDPARNRRGLCRHVDRPSLRGRELRCRLDHVDRGRNDFAFALSIGCQANVVTDGV